MLKKFLILAGVWILVLASFYFYIGLRKELNAREIVEYLQKGPEAYFGYMEAKATGYRPTVKISGTLTGFSCQARHCTLEFEAVIKNETKYLLRAYTSDMELLQMSNIKSYLTNKSAKKILIIGKMDKGYSTLMSDGKTEEVSANVLGVKQVDGNLID